MCRSIRRLRIESPPTTTGDLDAAALQFVRKISGMRAPSRSAAPAFDAAVADIARASAALLAALGVEPLDGPATPPALWPKPSASELARRDRHRSAPSEAGA
jgi:hypothetical protein